MHRITTLLPLIFLCWQTSYGQELIRPDFIATYDFRCVKDTVSNEYFKPQPFLLISNGKTSRFHHLHAQFNDSIVIAYSAVNPQVPHSEGKERSANASREFMAYFSKTKKPFNMSLWTEKDLRENSVTASVLWRIPSYHLEISYPLPWLLDPSAVDTINGVACRVATLDYGGRKWTAYYNTEIAIPQGPYVFSGLPGLIVRIEDERGWYRFDLAGFTAKPKEKYFWRGRYYNSGSQKMARSEYVDRVNEEKNNPSMDPLPVDEAHLLKLKQRFSRYYWWLLEQR